MSQEAKVIPNVMPINRYSVCDGIHFIEFKIDGWDEVKKHTKLVLEFEGRHYTWSCWNSDRMVSIFRSPGFSGYATIVKRRKNQIA